MTTCPLLAQDVDSSLSLANTQQDDEIPASLADLAQSNHQSPLLSPLQETSLTQSGQENKPHWFTAPIVLDWVLVFGLQAVCHYQDRQQPFKNDPKLWLDDPSVQYPHVEVQRYVFAL